MTENLKLSNSFDIKKRKRVQLLTEGARQIEEMSKKLEKMKRDQAYFKNKVQEIYSKNGTDPKEIEERVAQREKTSPKAFQRAQNKRSEIIESINIPEEIKTKVREHFGLDKNPASAKNQLAKKTPRIRNIGSAPRRGWLPMR